MFRVIEVLLSSLIAKGMAMNISIKIARDADGRYRAWVPTLPGCVVYGLTHDEVRDRIEQAICGYVASLNVATPRQVNPMLQSFVLHPG